DASAEPVEEWELFPATSMQGHDNGPLETTPFGPSCFVASSLPAGAPELPVNVPGDHVKVCRVAGNGGNRSVSVSLEVGSGGQLQSLRSTTLPFHVVQGARVGDALRVRVERSGTSTVVRVFTAAEVGPDGSMQWLPFPDG